MKSLPKPGAQAEGHSLVPPELEEKIRAWLAGDPDEGDRLALKEELELARFQKDALHGLQTVFDSSLTFGTAGLRGEMGPGPGRMNTAVVLRATYGLASVLRERVGEGFRVVIGYDARHRSFDFAREAASAVAGMGGKAELMPFSCPTPLLAFTLVESEADCAVMVTASHNPAKDNGYKVYLGGRVVSGWGQGAQLVSPWDSQIMSAIAAAPPATEVTRSKDFTLVDSSVWSRYRERAGTLVAPRTPEALSRRSQLRLVLTSLHGVGAELCESVLHDSGFTKVFPVTQQREPDPDFPTVSFPNPEEIGALDLAFSLAQEIKADLILANDPDADRCSAAIPCPEAKDGWRQLTGDEVGVLLGWQACEMHRMSEPLDGVTVARSMVSGELLDPVARLRGIVPMVSLTGFKWIARTPGLIFGYEEALGNCVDPSAVRDKDGISAALRLAELAANLKAEGRSLQYLLDDLAVQHGCYVTAPLTFRVTNLKDITEGMRRLRDAGLSYLGSEPVTFRLDLSKNHPRNPQLTSVEANWQNLAELPPTDALFFGCDSGTRVVVRPSGTEPKLKCYLQVVAAVKDHDSLPQSRRRARRVLEDITAQLRATLGF